PWSHLVGIYSDLGQLEKALEPSQHLIRLRPDVAFFYPWLIGVQRKLDRLSEARKTCDSAISRWPDDSDLRSVRYVLAFVEGDTKAMAEQVAWFDKKSSEIQFSMLALEADTQEYGGHVRAAREFTRRAVGAALQASNTGNAAYVYLSAAWREVAFGNLLEAKKQATA